MGGSAIAVPRGTADAFVAAQDARQWCGPSEDEDAVAVEGGADVGAEGGDFAEVDGAVEGVFEEEAGFVHADEGEGAAVLDLDGEVDVTVGAVVAAGDGAEDGEVADAAATQFRLGGGELQGDGV